MKTLSTPSMKHLTSWPPSIADQEVSPKSAEYPRAYSKLPSILRKQPSSPQFSMPSPNWPAKKDNSTNLHWKESPNSSKPSELISKKPTTTTPHPMPFQSLPSTTKRTELTQPSPDLKPKTKDFKTNSTD